MQAQARWLLVKYTILKILVTVYARLHHRWKTSAAFENLLHVGMFVYRSCDKVTHVQRFYKHQQGQKRYTIPNKQQRRGFQHR
jgi:hypothetical protein